MHQSCLVSEELHVLGRFVALGHWAPPLASLCLSFLILRVGELCIKCVGSLLLPHLPGACFPSCVQASYSSFQPMNMFGFLEPLLGAVLCPGLLGE